MSAPDDFMNISNVIKSLHGIVNSGNLRAKLQDLNLASEEKRVYGKYCRMYERTEGFG